MFKKILVANRGEIALRIMRTIKKMGIKAVAVYSEADSNAEHVQYADEAYFLGGAPATESYLSIPKIIKAIKNTEAEAVHPGYGFLSENYKFAHKLEKEKVKLIGPSADAIKNMGDKIEAKKIAKSAKVNTIPGYIGNVKTTQEAIKIANKIGFPVMVKASSGGGGKGIRIANNENEMAEAFNATVVDAMNNYLDKRVFIEKLIHDKPRHIEIQVLADEHGNVICLGERECSIQRSHQKVIEEAPSIFLDDKMRKKMYQQCKNLVKKVGYYSAGTVEFIVDANKNFYFLEMNTRLQVEHTVTELITDIDIVEQMVKIAAGQKLLTQQKNLKMTGWAIECRICAEDPTRGFLPSSGKIIKYQEPTQVGVRVDSGITSGSEVSIHYDSMLTKLCTFADTRQNAINLMKDALGAFIIKGVNHNISFLEALVSHEKFIKGDINTGFIKQEYPKGFEGAELTSNLTEIFLAAGLYMFLEEKKRQNLSHDRLDNKPYQIHARWIVCVDESYFPLVVRAIDNGYSIRQGKNRIKITSDWHAGTSLMSCKINNVSANIKVESKGSKYLLTYAGITATVFVRSNRIAELESIMKHFDMSDQVTKELISPLSGQVVKVLCKQKDVVKAGQELISLVAMKMQNSIKAPNNGVIKNVLVKENDNVTTNQVLIEFE